MTEHPFRGLFDETVEYLYKRMTTSLTDLYDQVVKRLDKEESVYGPCNNLIQELDILSGYLFVLADIKKQEGGSKKIELDLSDINSAISASVQDIREILATSLEGDKERAKKHISGASRKTLKALDLLNQLNE